MMDIKGVLYVVCWAQILVQHSLVLPSVTTPCLPGLDSTAAMERAVDAVAPVTSASDLSPGHVFLWAQRVPCNTGTREHPLTGKHSKVKTDERKCFFYSMHN